MSKTRFLSLLISLMLVVPAAQAALTCESVFAPSVWKESGGKPFPQDPATLKRVAKEQKESLKVSEFLMQEMTRQSTALKKEFKGKTIELDVLCLGAGPQCAAASLVLGKTNLKSLVVEKTDLVAKTFAEKDFYINSIEAHRLSMHDFPGGVGSLSHLTSQTYAHSTQLATHIQSQQYVSKVPVMLETTVVAANKVLVDGKVMIEVVTDQGVTLRAKNVILGTGLGEVGTKVKDTSYQTAFAEYQKLHQAEPAVLRPIMSTDAFLVSLRESRLQKQGVHMPRDLIIIGNGDGSRIAIEGLLNPHVKTQEDFKIHWIGNTFRTAEEYIQSQNGWDRYVDMIVPQYQKNRVSGLPGHVEKVELLKNGRYLVTVRDAKNNIVSQAEGDMIIDSTGYTNLNGQLLSNVVKSPELVDVLGPLKELSLSETVLARQYADAGGEKLPIYAVGSAAGMLAKDTELAGSPNKNPVAIFNTVARTSQFISQLIGTKPLESQRGVRTERPDTRSSQEIIKDLKVRRGAH
ncbi:hypothetical protein AB1A81_13035 [Bdellovibrio bacteriovorus]|uniref:hypothetical protein n=1 Tax=Bdellovibrio bacteriovorus TaxID=959 RepID=UPI00030C317D|nr:hypothetical protein [Bdellovibrio bacteriovorus]